MRELFEVKTYTPSSNDRIFKRDSARSIIIKDNKVAMVHSLKYDYYKFPGGGIEDNETIEETLIRETLEEAGLIVIKDSIKEYGVVRRIDASNQSEKYDCFMQDNYYYLCDVEDKIISQKLDDYEADERFTLEFVKPSVAIKANRKEDHGPKSKAMIEREAKVLELLIKEKYLDDII